MKIDKITLDKLANLAKLEFSQEESKEMIQELNMVLEWVEKLKEIDTENVEPLSNMSQEINRLREDEAGPSHDPHSVLKNAPEVNSGYFKVPKVIR